MSATLPPEAKEAISRQSLAVDRLVEDVTGRRLDERETAIVWAILTVQAKETR